MALVGYRDLAWLKSRILPSDMSEETTFDTDLSNIGLGVASAFDRYTARKLRREVGHVYTTPADIEDVIVDLYPIEEITDAELVVDGVASDISDAIRNTLRGAGIVYFHGPLSVNKDLLRLTITGGFWCQDGDEEQPEGSEAIPEDLLNAWVAQVRAICDAENTFRQKGAEKPDKKALTAGGNLTGFTEGVKQTLQLYIRF